MGGLVVFLASGSSSNLQRCPVWETSHPNAWSTSAGFLPPKETVSGFQNTLAHSHLKFFKKMERKGGFLASIMQVFQCMCQLIYRARKDPTCRVWRRGIFEVKDGPVAPPSNHESLSKYGGGGVTLVVFPLSCLDNSVQYCAVSPVAQSRNSLCLRIHSFISRITAFLLMPSQVGEFTWWVRKTGINAACSQMRWSNSNKCT